MIEETHRVAMAGASGGGRGLVSPNTHQPLSSSSSLILIIVLTNPHPNPNRHRHPNRHPHPYRHPNPYSDPYPYPLCLSYTATHSPFSLVAKYQPSLHSLSYYLLSTLSPPPPSPTPPEQLWAEAKLRRQAEAEAKTNKYGYDLENFQQVDDPRPN